jgi:hypothetical protein
MSRTLTQRAELLGYKKSTLDQRYYVYGWNINRVLNTPTQKYRRQLG